MEGDKKGDKILVEFPIYREDAFNINVKEGDKITKNHLMVKIESK
jgi:hypothetical protein